MTKIELDALLAFIDAKIEYELASLETGADGCYLSERSERDNMLDKLKILQELCKE